MPPKKPPFLCGGLFLLAESPKVADISSKRLINLVPTDWLRWATDLPDIQAIEVIDADFQWISRHSDAVVRAQTPDLGEFLVLNEVQLRYTDKMPARMGAYTGLAREKFRLSVYPILINLLPSNENAEILDRYEEEFLGKKALQEYHVINLWEVDAQLAFSQKPLLPFVPIMKGGDDQKLIQQALNKLRADDKLQELEMTLAFFASFVLESKIIQQIMRWDMIVLRESPWYQQILSEGRQIEREEAMERERQAAFRHRQEAMERERQAAFRHVLQILEHNFGEMPQEVTASLQALDTAALETLLGVALSVANLEEFQQHPLLG